MEFGCVMCGVFFFWKEALLCDANGLMPFVWGLDVFKCGVGVCYVMCGVGVCLSHPWRCVGARVPRNTRCVLLYELSFILISDSGYPGIRV